MPIKTCKKHGDSEHRIEKRKDGNPRYRCCICACEAVKKRRKKVKELLVEYKGGKCEMCGYDKCYSAMHFHHVASNKKDFGISRNGHCRSIEALKKEVDKCRLLCANCHAEIHENR